MTKFKLFWISQKPAANHSLLSLGNHSPHVMSDVCKKADNQCLLRINSKAFHFYITLEDPLKFKNLSCSFFRLDLSLSVQIFEIHLPAPLPCKLLREFSREKNKLALLEALGAPGEDGS
jgi:hypothetical protein